MSETQCSTNYAIVAPGYKLLETIDFSLEIIKIMYCTVLYCISCIVRRYVFVFEQKGMREFVHQVAE